MEYLGGSKVIRRVFLSERVRQEKQSSRRRCDHRSSHRIDEIAGWRGGGDKPRNVGYIHSRSWEIQTNSFLVESSEGL